MALCGSVAPMHTGGRYTSIGRFAVTGLRAG